MTTSAIAKKPVSENPDSDDRLYFEKDIPLINQEILKSEPRLFPIKHLIAEYALAHFFGHRAWKEVYDIDLYENPKVPKILYNFLASRDPFDPTKYVFETHLLPILLPGGSKCLNSNTIRLSPILGAKIVFSRHIENPLNGISCQIHSEFNHSNLGYQESSPSRWVLLRKEVVGIGDTFSKGKTIIKMTQAGYAEDPSLMQVALPILISFTISGKRCLPKNIGTDENWATINLPSPYSWLFEDSQLQVGNFSYQNHRTDLTRILHIRYKTNNDCFSKVDKSDGGVPALRLYIAK